MTTFWKSNFNLSGMFAKLLDWRLLLQRSYLMKTLPYYMDALQKNCFLSPQSLLQGVPVLTECCWSQGAQAQSPVGWKVFFWLFLIKTKQDQAPSSHVHGKI